MSFTTYVQCMEQPSPECEVLINAYRQSLRNKTLTDSNSKNSSTTPNAMTYEFIMPNEFDFVKCCQEANKMTPKSEREKVLVRRKDNPKNPNESIVYFSFTFIPRSDSDNDSWNI